METEIATHDDQISQPRKIFNIVVTTIKVLYSLALLAFSIAILMTANETDRKVKGPGAIILFWVLIIWLAYLEGGQNALVGLQPVDKTLYAHTHKISHICTTLAHKGNNMERFIIGRQLLVVIVVFVISLTSSINEGCSRKFGMADWLEEIFCGSGIAFVIVTLSIGQLTSQIVSATHMLALLNNYIMIVTTAISLFIEFSGLLHTVYLVQLAFSKFAAKDEGEKKPEEKSLLEKIFFWARVLMSLLFLSFSFAVVLSEIGKGRTKMWNGVPAGASIVIFFVLMVIVGHLEGMQIAMFSVMRNQSAKKTKIAQACCDVAFKGENLRKIVVGRQIMATICMFVIARITSLDGDHPDFDIRDETTLNAGSGFQELALTNLLSALITTIVASLSFRIIASSFPMIFLSNPLVLIIFHICLFLEGTGIMHSAWFLAQCIKYVLRPKPDEDVLRDARKVVPDAKTSQL